MRIHLQHRMRSRRGAALLLAVLLLLVLVAIVFQINVATSTQARVGRNEIGLSSMDLSIESALLEVYDKLKLDGEGASGSESNSSGQGQGQGQNPAMPGGTPGANGADAAGGGGDQAAACDSRRDEWARPARTEINEIKLRIVIQDEDSKVNVLTMLAEDPKEAKAAFDRVVRVIDKFREGTRVDVDSGQAEEMARAMLEYMTKGSTDLARATQLSADPNKKELRLPRSLREFQVLSPFEPLHFRDFRDEDGARVHSLESFLTVWTALITAAESPNAAPAAGGSGGGAGSSNSNTRSPTGSNPASGQQGSSGTPGSSSGQKTSTGQNSTGSGSGSGGSGSSGGSGTNAGSGAGAGSGSSSGSSEAGGWQVNLNTAPVAVLKSLFEDREVPQRFWDEVIEYRNLPEEEEESSEGDDSEEEPLLDEFGREIVNYRIFESLQELEEIDGYADLSAEAKTKIQSSLTVTSNVFSITVIARRVTSVEDGSELLDDPQAVEEAEEKGDSLVRVVRSVVWRHQDAEENLVITPVLRWEVLDTIPREVLDFPEERR